MILIFDTYSGLCNQFYDITNAINFCFAHRIQFTFRNSSLRNNDLTSWRNIPFYELFDHTFLHSAPYNELYRDIWSFPVSNENAFNWEQSVCANKLLRSDQPILDQLQEISRRTKKEYIVLKQFWAVYSFQSKMIDVYPHIRPCQKIMEELNKVKRSVFPDNIQYNFLHYRWEHDFTSHFRIRDMPSLDHLIETVVFNEPELPLYIASTNIRNQLRDRHVYKQILYKDEDNMGNLNFEERAFIDFMIGIESIQVMGNKQSSFSEVLNTLKGTDYYYST